jgi:hypothetical protein
MMADYCFPFGWQVGNFDDQIDIDTTKDNYGHSFAV